MENSEGLTVVVLAVAGFVLVMMVITAVARHANRKRLELLTPLFEMGTARVVGLFGRTVVGLISGYQCRYSVQPRSNNSPGGATLVVPVVSPHEWSVSTSGVGSRLMVKAGVLQDVEIGDPELDENLRFAAADPTLPGAVFGDLKVRDALRALVSTEHFSAIKLKNSRLIVRWVPFDRQLEKNADAIRQRFENTTGMLKVTGTPPGSQA